MKLRIAVWAGAGFLVAAFWAVYLLFSHATVAGPLWILIDITCPIAFLRFYPISLYVVLLANAATYALIGLVVESLRRKLSPAR